MAIKTLDVDLLGSQYDNIYEAVCVTAKRARQISAEVRSEMTDRLSYFDGFDRDPEDRRMNDQQVGISLEYERAPKPTELALDELVARKLAYRYAEPDPADL
ncbi:MAG TPA: DNA-directed RNA polymerase subunit omega [Bacteroidetes bacterium]|nr:DNA-directed RNA polymerase subunit omega [Bacteroidetes Order II. bacterium]HCR49277.1 DNA-directed RNA polymerase subunit omega [Bacteroidota bacterium]HRR07255.1 DNA-directed RNA polymerase subunit omega [Rhodothermales bacterium]